MSHHQSHLVARSPLTETARRDGAALARLAGREDVAAVLDSDAVVTGGTTALASIVINDVLRPDTHEVELHAWHLPDNRTVYALVSALVDRGGGDADVEETVIITEYDLTNAAVLDAVVKVAGLREWVGGGMIPPRSAEIRWSSTNSPLRTALTLTGASAEHRARAEQHLTGLRAELHAGMLAWVEAVNELWTADPRPLPLPKVAWRRL